MRQNKTIEGSYFELKKTIKNNAEKGITGYKKGDMAMLKSIAMAYYHCFHNDILKCDYFNLERGML